MAREVALALFAGGLERLCVFSHWLDEDYYTRAGMPASRNEFRFLVLPVLNPSQNAQAPIVVCVFKGECCSES